MSELAAAYVTILPTTKGIQGALEKELSPLSGVAAKAGDDSGKALGSSFTGASGGFKSSLEGSAKDIGDFKGKASSAFDNVKANAGLFGVAAAGALVDFGIKAVGAFTDTAKAALDLSTSTGLNVEDASRWIGVGDDFQVGSDALATGLGKIAKSLDDNKWKTYGIETHDAGGKARDVNDILLDTFDTLSKVDNKTEQARIGQELFGKGYQSLTPILGHTREEYEKMLGSVEKGQVITKEEAEKAEKFRLAEDSLKDALHEVTLKVGEQVAGLAPLIEGMVKYIELVDRAQSAGVLPNPLQGISSTIDNATDAWDIYSGASDRRRESERLGAAQTAESARETSRLTSGLDEAITKQDETEAAMRNSQNAVDGYSYAAKSATETIAGMERQNKSMTDDLKRGLDADKSAMDRLLGVVNDDESWLNLQNNFADTAALFDDKGNVIVEKGKDAAQSMRDAALAVDGLKKGVIEYGSEVLGLPTQRITDIVAAVDPQNLADVEALMANLTRNRNVSLSIVAKGGAGYSTEPTFAKGGYTPGGTVMVGEKGRELVELPKGSYVHTAADTRGIMSGWSSSANTVLAGNNLPPINVYNYRRDIGVADLNQILAMARLRS